MTTDIEEIGIVGIGCRFPGANDIHEFWKVLENGENHVKDIPKERWDNDKIYSENVDEPGKIYVNKAGLLSDHDRWDNRLFGISDLEAVRIDPQQRYVLECTHMALEDGGFTREQISGTNTGVFIGVMNDDYKNLLGTDHNEDTNFTATGLSTTVIASRVSYVYNLHGPCITIDTACSSAMMALHLGCQAIRAGECDIAICGGVSSILSPDMFLPLCKARMLSKTGQCQTFCDTADGYARGEGCGIVILQSTKEPNRIKNLWGILQTGINQDGRAATPMTAPSSKQQQELLHNIYGKFRVNPKDLDFIEVHGTGTPIGDPTEIDAISTFIKSKLKETNDANFSRKILMGSVKTNIGHTESAAGVAGIIKVLLMMRHEKFVRSLHIKEDKANLNKRIKLEDTILDISVRTTEWPKNEFGNRVACVNSFGFGGSNGHAVIKQQSNINSTDIPENNEDDIRDSNAPYFVCICGKDKMSLSRNIECFMNDSKLFKENLRNVSYTSLLYRDKHEYRTLLYGTTLSDIRQKANLESYSAIESVHEQNQNIVFVFCGVGTAWPKMGEIMMKKHDVFLKTVKKINAYMKVYSNHDLEEMLTSTENYSDPFLNHVAIFTVQVALFEVWKSLGIVPDTIIGQSVGEVAAAYASGAINLASAVKVIYHRSKILAQKKGGAMTVIGNVALSYIEKVCLMPKHHDSLNIAVYNSPTSCTVSGLETAIKELEREMSSYDGAFIRSLKVVCAYHSRLMDECLPDITSSLTDLESNTDSNIPQISTVTGKLIKPKELTSADYWAQNVRKPVLFMQAVGLAAKDECRNVYLEIGPRQVLRTHLPNILSEKQKYTCLPSMNLNDENCIYSSLTKMFELGIDIDLQAILPQNGKLGSLPRYHFNRTSSLFVSNLTKQYLSGLSRSSGSNHYVEKIKEDLYNILINQETTKFVFDHQLLGHITVPGATYVEAVIASASEFLRIPSDILEMSCSFENPCMVEKGPTTVLTCSFNRNKEKGNKYLEYNVSASGRILCKGHVNERKPTEYHEIDVKALRMFLTRYKSQDEIYGALEKIGLTYGESLRLLKECFFIKDECISMIHIPTCIKSEVKRYTIHPAIVDAMLQASGVLSNTGNNSRSFSGIPKGFKSLKVYTAMQENMIVYTKLTKKTRKNSYYTSVLCTEKGTIIAEIEDLTIRTLDTTIPNDDISYELVWCKQEMSEDFMKEDTDIEKKELIVFGSERLKNWLSKGNCSFTFSEIPGDQNNFKQLVLKAMSNFKKGQKIVFGPCLKYNELPKQDTIDIYNVIKSNANSLKTIFNILQSSVENTSSVFIVTEMTQHLLSKKPEKTNFLGAELWGFTRSAMTEMPNEDIRLIDVDLQDENILPFVSLVLNNKNRISESLIRGGNIYVNEIRPSITQDITTFQTSASDSFMPLALYSNPLDESEPFLVADNQKLETKGVQGDKERIKVATVYVNNHDKTTSKLNISFLAQNSNFPPKQQMKSNEFLGWIFKDTDSQDDCNSVKENENNIHGACFPVTVFTVVTVPRSCCFDLKDVPFYRPGLISETLILWKLRKQVKPHSNALVVVSDTNCWRAKTLARFLNHAKSKGKVISWTDLPSIALTNESFSYALVIQFENASNICMLNTVIGLQYVICVNSWLPWDSESVHFQNILNAEVLILKSEDILSEKCCMKLVPKVLKYLKTDASFFEAILPKKLNNGNVSNVSESYGSFDVQTVSMETKIPVILFPSSCFTRDGYYIFVGGTSGLGWELLQYCAQLGAGNLVTISRRGLTKEKKSEIERVEYLYRCHIHHIRADVTDFNSLQNGFNILKNKNAKVKGIFNGAGVLKDTLLNKMTTEDLETALRPKVLGTLNLHRVSKDIPLDFFVTHSSITSILGNPGQCNYAAGNSFQDSFAFYRASHGLSAQSINWGALQVGMARESGPDFENRFRRQGIHILNVDDVKNCFNEMILTKDIQKIFGIFDWQRFVQSPIYSSSQNKFRSMVHNIDMQQEKQMVSAANKFLSDDFHTLPLEKKKENLTDVIQLTLKDSLMIEKESLHPNTSLYKLGIDSMSAMSISNSLHQHTSIRVPVVFLLSNTTSIEGIVSYLLRELESCDVDKNIEDEEPINHDILDGSVTFMQESILKNLENEKSENFIRSICYEIKSRRISAKKWRHIIRLLLNLHPGLRQIFLWDSVDGRFQAKEIEIDKVTVPIDIVSFEDIFNQSESVSLDPRNQIPIKIHLACKGRTTRMKLFLHAVVVDMQSIHILFRDLEICARHYFLQEKLPDIGQHNVAETVRLALIPMLKEMRAFWKRQFSLSLEPFSFSPSALNKLDEIKWREIGHVFSDKQFDNVLSFTRNEKITLYNFIISVYFLCINELTGHENIPLVTNTNIRGFIPSLENVLTRCINEVPVIGRVNQRMTISEYLQEMALQLNMVTEHGAYPYELIRQEMKSEKLQQNIGRHRFIIDDISNVSRQSVKKDVTVKINSVQHRRHNYETCMFIYHDMKAKTLSLDLGFNSEALSTSQANQMLARIEFLVNQLTSCDLTMSVEDTLRVNSKILNETSDYKNQSKETFVFEDILGKSEKHQQSSNECIDKNGKLSEIGPASTKKVMHGSIEKQSATGNVYDVDVWIQERKRSNLKSEFYLCWTYFNNNKQMCLNGITEIHLKKMGGRYCLLLQNGVKGWLQFNAKTYQQARSWFDTLKSAIEEGSQREESSNWGFCYL